MCGSHPADVGYYETKPEPNGPGTLVGIPLDYDPSEVWLQLPDGTVLSDLECLDLYGLEKPMEDYHAATKDVTVGPTRILLAEQKLQKVKDLQYEVVELEKAFKVIH